MEFSKNISDLVRITLISILVFLGLLSIPIVLKAKEIINWLWFWILVTADFFVTVIILAVIENLIESKR